MKKLSIIIPAYNVEDYICRCLDSICSQLQTWVEVIVVDDGSADSTSNCIIPYTCKYPKQVKYIKQNNSGPSSARNNGLKLSTGDFIWFVDADDYIKSSAIASIGKLMVQFDQTEIFFASFSHNGKKCCLGYSEDTIYSGETFCLLNPSFYIHQMIYNKLFLNKYHLIFGSSNNIEDFHFNMKALYYAKSMRYINEILYYYDNRPGSISTSRQFAHLISLSDDTIFVLKDLCDFFSREKACPSVFFQMIFHSVNGLLYSWLTLGYPIKYIYSKIEELKALRLYPAQRTRSRKSNFFSLVGNKKYVFLFLCWINKKIHLFHE